MSRCGAAPGAPARAPRSRASPVTKRAGAAPARREVAASMAADAAASAPARNSASRPDSVRARTVAPASPHTCAARAIAGPAAQAVHTDMCPCA